MRASDWNLPPDRLDAHFDIAAAALIGGLTNVVTLASGVGDPYFSVNLYTTLLSAVGERREYFGVHDPMLKGDATGNGPLPKLLA